MTDENEYPPLAASKPAQTSSPALNRPPAPPGSHVGPTIQFITTENKTKTWMGSMLLLQRTHLPRPDVKLQSDAIAKIASWDCLEEDIFGMVAWRLNIEISLRDGLGNDEVHWTVDWGLSSSKKPSESTGGKAGLEGKADVSDETVEKAAPHAEDTVSKGRWTVPRWDQKWRFGFNSCNGFDATVPKARAHSLTYDNVWNHLHSVHAETPLHFLVWGGDQNYIDFIFDDIPFLKRWTQMEWDKKWSHEYADRLRQQVEEYHFNTYCENWEKRPEVKNALSGIPHMMQWDDHDIFDGAGSYPPQLHNSPLMQGLFTAAQRFRLLFQLHTTPAKCRKHQLWGVKSHNWIAQCGPRMAVFMADQRSERNDKTIVDKNTWNEVWQRIQQLPSTTRQLLCVFAVPFSFVRFQYMERIFDKMNQWPDWVRHLPGLKGQQSIFSLPELYDDLLDEWTHEAHLPERNAALEKLQEIAKAKSMRVTLLSGDVHCCALSRFRSPMQTGLAPLNDANLMYQVIASAIVNQPPPRMALICYHYLYTSWSVNANTREELLPIFERMPEHGRKLRHRKILPNRNWCFVEQTGPPKDQSDDIKSDEKSAPANHRDTVNTTSEMANGTSKVANNDKISDQGPTLNTNANGTEAAGVSTSEMNDSRGNQSDTGNGLPTSKINDSHHSDNVNGESRENAESSMNSSKREHPNGLTNDKYGDYFNKQYPMGKHGYPTTLGPVSSPSGKGSRHKPLHEHSHGPFCHHRRSKNVTKGALIDREMDVPAGNELKIRLWLESSKRKETGRQFASYQVIVPELILDVSRKLGWGSLIAAGGIAYFFAKRDINERRLRQNRPEPMEWWQTVAINEKENEHRKALKDSVEESRHRDPVGSPGQEINDPAPNALRRAKGTSAGGRSKGDRL